MSLEILDISENITEEQAREIVLSENAALHKDWVEKNLQWLVRNRMERVNKYSKYADLENNSIQNIASLKDGNFELEISDNCGGSYDEVMTKEQLIAFANKLLEFAEKA